MARARRIARALILVAVVAGCSGRPAATPGPTPTAAVEPGYVTRADYGAEWPFSVPAGTLRCYLSGKNDGRLLVVFTTGNGIEYALNGSARSFGFPELDATILPSWPDMSMLGDLIERGLALCP